MDTFTGIKLISAAAINSHQIMVKPPIFMVLVDFSVCLILLFPFQFHLKVVVHYSQGIAHKMGMAIWSRD